MVPKFDQKKIGNINRNIILKTIQQKRDITQKEIVSVTGLQKSTVSIITNHLLTKNIITKKGEGQSSRKGGRKPVKLEINVKNKNFCLIHATRDLIRTTLIDIYGGEIWRKELPISSNEFNEVIRDAILLVQKEFPAMKLLGVGISIPGIVNYSTGEIIFSTQLSVSRFNLRNYLAKTFKGVIVIENNANLAAIAEKTKGLCQDTDDFISLFLEYHFSENSYLIGLGSGLVIDSKIYRGKNFSSGETSQILNKIVSEKLKMNSPYLSEKIPSVLNLKFQEGNFSQVLLLAGKDDETAVDIVRGIVRELGGEIALIVNYLDPMKVIIGGSISPYNNSYFLSELKAGINEKLFPFLENVISIEISNLGDNILSVGLLELLINKIYPIPNFDQSFDF